MKPEPIDRVTLLLFFGIVLFVAVLFAAEIWFMSDSQMFQVVASLLTGFSGAFLGRITPKNPASGTTGTSVTTASPAATVTVTPDQKSET